MHQSNNYYWKQFSAFLVQDGFTPSSYGPCMFIGPLNNTDQNHQLAGIEYMPVQVDDIACFHEDSPKAEANWLSFLDRLSKYFAIGEHGHLRWHCQQKITFHEDGTISASHARHVKAFLAKHDALHCKPRATPYEKGEIQNIQRLGMHS